ncbi:hypothetical protein B9Z19DRAFT_1069483 [Tuber borchii]|uniref:Uncharacterized protein n=1 Tax=Tuber borchii TaxID=42251 RepID=A0A2T6ZBF8_TUBBO|nr:hypothetical protein B9Z19DRAFT_1069483 [Tuber borchii]
MSKMVALNQCSSVTGIRGWGKLISGRGGPCLEKYDADVGDNQQNNSSLAVDSLCDQARGKDITIGALYCDFHAQLEQSTTNMLGAIHRQLVCGDRIPDHILEAFQNANKLFGDRSLRLPDVVECLKRTIKSLARVFICIDGLDGCTPQHRRELLESLREIVRESPNARVFLTGRPHINDEIVRCFIEVARIPLSSTHEDIKRYLEMRLNLDVHPAMDGKLRAHIMETIPKMTEINLLLVSLNMDTILGETTISRRRKKLDEIARGKGIGDAYAAILSQIMAQPRSRSKLGMDVLMWMSHAERPLHVEELCHALVVEEGSPSLNINKIRANTAPVGEKIYDNCCLGLVTVESSSSTVRLVHNTLQEYLSHNPNLFLNPHSVIAGVCLTYLNSRHIRGLSPTLRSAPSTAPFLIYASCYWGAHARRETTESVKILALKLLYAYDKHVSSKMLLLHGIGGLDQPFDSEDTPRGFTGLHGAAYLGCTEVVVALLEANTCDSQGADFNGNTAIAWAAGRGHEEVVRVLLERSDVDPNTANATYGQTPLSLAAKNGHGGAVGILLERNDINPNKADKWGQTPLLLATENGHEGIVGMLLERSDISANKVDEWSRAPLSLAAGSGHEGIVKMLLERNDVNPGHSDNRSQTLLSWALKLSWVLKNGHKRIARLLREKTESVLKYAARPKPTESFPEPSERLGPPSKSTRGF